MEEVDNRCPMIRMGVSGCFFWYRPTRVVPYYQPLNGCVCVCARARAHAHAVDGPEALCLFVVRPSVCTCMPMAEAFSKWLAVGF